VTGLPTPSLTCTIDGRGNVTIAGEELVKPAGGVTGRTNAPTHCRACGGKGHTARNRKCPARVAPDQEIAARKRQGP
jgi:zinc knuckle protein